MTQEEVIDDFISSLKASLSQKAIELLLPELSVLVFPKKHLLVKEGKTSKQVFWIVSGAVRSFYIHNGKEINTWFAFENEIAGSLRNYTGRPSRESVELLEESTLIALNIEGLQRLSKMNVELAHFIHAGILEYALYLEDKVYHIHLKSARERFKALLEHEPEVFQRVSLTHIASFLGISRETLSRLRAN